MKRDIKINFAILEEIICEIGKYRAAAAQMERAAVNMLHMLQEDDSKAIEELQKIYNGFSTELKTCETELKDLETVLKGYSNEMQSIIKPINKQKFMRVDRNDIWVNKQAIEFDCGILFNNLRNERCTGIETSIGKSEEQKHREKENYRKLTRIWHEAIPRFERQMNAQIDALNNLHNRRIIPFENKDDEYKTKAGRVYDKYTNTWETIRTLFNDVINLRYDFIRGMLDAIIDLCRGLVELACMTIYHDIAVTVLVIEKPFNMQPKWAEDVVNKNASATYKMLYDPTVIVEALAQQISDALDQEGVAYCNGYLTGSLLGEKGLDKIAKLGQSGILGKAGQLEKSGLIDNIIDEVPVFGTTGEVRKILNDTVDEVRSIMNNKLDDVRNELDNILADVPDDVDNTANDINSGVGGGFEGVGEAERVVNGKGNPYPKVEVEGNGEVPFPDGPYEPNNSSTLRPQFTDSYKKQFKEWWTGQGKPWPEGEVNIHHIKPLSKGGDNSFENLVPLVQPEEHQPFTNWWRSYPPKK